MFKNVSELSPDLISLLEQKIRHFEVCKFSAFEKRKKVPVVLLDERVKKMFRLFPKIDGFGGIPGPETYQMKTLNTPNVDACAVINSTSKSEVFPT